MVSARSGPIHFKELDTLRCLAAFGVVVHHIEKTKFYLDIPGYWITFFVQSLGKESVRLFFAISGFLITYLLLSELKKNGKIKIGSFYIRRALRIWPLYYFIMLLAFFVVPLFSAHCSVPWVKLMASAFYQDFWQKLLLYVTFLPNLAVQIYRPVMGADQYWSLGVEEQFYLILPLLFLLYARRPLMAIIGVILIKLVLMIAFEKYGHLATTQMQSVISGTLNDLQFECLATGGLGAYLLHKKAESLECLGSTPVKILSVALTILMLAIDFPFRNIISPVIYTTLILSSCVSPLPDFKVFVLTRRLGKLSYGLYMYHPLLLLVLFFIPGIAGGASFIRNNQSIANLLCYGYGVMATVLVSALSFRYLERPFLNLKKRFTVIETIA